MEKKFEVGGWRFNVGGTSSKIEHRTPNLYERGSNQPLPPTPTPHESGAALVTVLLMVSLLTLVGNAAVTTSTIETKIGENYAKSARAFYASEAGLEEAKARLKGLQSDANYAGDPASPPDASWSAYLLTDSSWTTSGDPNYNSDLKNYIPTPASHTATAVSANSLQTDIKYWVKLWYKREYDAEQAGHTTASPLYVDQDGSTATHTASSPGNIIYYGYKNYTSTTLEEYTFSGASSGTGFSVLIARSYGHEGTSQSSTNVLEIELRRNPGAPITGAVYGDSFDGSGTASSVNGNDDCGQAEDVAAVAYSNSADPPSYQNTTPITDATDPSYITPPLDITAIVAGLEENKTIVLTSSSYTGVTYGSSTNYEVVYVDATSFTNSLVKFSNLTGYGTIAVVGNAEFSGSLAWKGLIIATGDIDFKGGGSETKTVEGAVLAGGEVDLGGKINILYDSCEVANANSAYSYSVARWQDTSL